MLPELVLLVVLVGGGAVAWSASARARAAEERAHALELQLMRSREAVAAAEQALRALANDTRTDRDVALQAESAILDVRARAAGHDPLEGPR